MSSQPLDPLPDWDPEERPRMPGSPALVKHSPGRRLAYGLVGLLVITTSGLGTGLVSANLQNIQGHLGLTPSEAAWLPAVYVMFNASANLILFKCRQRFGIRHFAEAGIAAYVLLCVLHLVVADYPTALLLRAVAGFAAAPMSALGMFYLMQAFPLKHLGRALCLALGLMQAMTPLAWVLSPSLASTGDFREIYRLELGMALLSLAAMVIVKLPQGIRIRVFEPLDFLSFALMAPAIALVGAVFAQMRYEWWEDNPWMAYAIIAAMAMALAAVLIEHHRARPLIMTRWLGTSDAFRFGMGAVGMRFLLSEQSYTAPGLLRTLGMGPDQLQPLYAVIFAATIVGAVISALMFGPKRVLAILGISIGLVIAGSYLEHNATNLTRPHDVYLSQLMISLATGMFMGPLLLMGITKALSRGTDHIVTFSVLFSLSQGIGGLAGPAVLGTYQLYREHEYSTVLVDALDPADPQVAQRIKLYQGAYAKAIVDPARRDIQALTLLAQAATREANVRAYNDASLLNSVIAFCFLFWTFASDIFRVLTGGIEKARRLTRRRLSVARYRQSRKLRTTPQ
jgi:MFS family permease